MITFMQAFAVLSLLMGFGVSQTEASTASPTVYLSSTFVHADGTREQTKYETFKMLPKAPVQPLPIKRF